MRDVNSVTVPVEKSLYKYGNEDNRAHMVCVIEHDTVQIYTDDFFTHKCQISLQKVSI